jgi:hypothetical protein
MQKRYPATCCVTIIKTLKKRNNDNKKDDFCSDIILKNCRRQSKYNRTI